MSTRTKARLRPRKIRINKRTSTFIGVGPLVRDHVSWFLVPLRDCVRQRGGWVSADYADNTRDRPKEY